MSDDESVYGSELSPEQEEIVLQLIASTAATSSPIAKDIEDISFVTEVGYHEPTSLSRVPHALGREQVSPLHQARLGADRIAEEISKSFMNTGNSPRERIVFINFVT